MCSARCIERFYSFWDDDYERGPNQDSRAQGCDEAQLSRCEGEGEWEDAGCERASGNQYALQSTVGPGVHSIDSRASHNRAQQEQKKKSVPHLDRVRGGSVRLAGLNAPGCIVV